MKKLHTVCARDCYDTCSLAVTLDENERIVSIQGDPDHPITQGFVCPRGTKDRERLIKNRVRTPMVRQNGKQEAADWDTALDIATRTLRETLDEHGPEAVLSLNYAGNMGLLSGAFPQRIWNALGAVQTDFALCSKSGNRGIALHYGDRYGTQPEELPEKDLIVFWGFNPAVSSPHLWSLAKKARNKRGAKIVVIDPRKSESAAQADFRLQPRPGTDVALAYGVMNRLIAQDTIDREFIEQWTQGFDELQSEAAQWTPKKVEELCRVPQKQIEALAELYADLGASVTMIGIGFQKSDNGADQARAVSLIPALLGVHRGFFYSNGSASFVDDDLVAGTPLTQKTSPVVPQVALADLVNEGRFKYIFISCMNPAMTLPNQNLFRAGLERDDVFVVVHETHWTQTCDFADLVLPAPTYLEKDDLVLSWAHDLVRDSPQILQPTTDSRSEVWLMQEMAKRLELQEEWLYADPWKVLKKVLENTFKDGDFTDLKSGKLLRLKKRGRKSYPTPSGKIEFYSTRAQEQGFNPLPQQASLSQKDGEFVFLSSASPHYTSTQFQECYGKIPAVLHINPLDAKAHNIKDDQTICIQNARGRLQVKAKLSELVPHGVLWSPRQSEDPSGIPQNSLMSSRPQTIGGGSRFNSTHVWIS